MKFLVLLILFFAGVAFGTETKSLFLGKASIDDLTPLQKQAYHRFKSSRWKTMEPCLFRTKNKDLERVLPPPSEKIEIELCQGSKMVFVSSPDGSYGKSVPYFYWVGISEDGASEIQFSIISKSSKNFSYRVRFFDGSEWQEWTLGNFSSQEPVFIFYGIDEAGFQDHP